MSSGFVGNLVNYIDLGSFWIRVSPLSCFEAVRVDLMPSSSSCILLIWFSIDRKRGVLRLKHCNSP